MKKRILAMIFAAFMVLATVGCGASSGDTDESSNGSSRASEAAVTTDKETLLSLEGTPLTDAMDVIDDLGYKATYLADGVDFTDFIDDMKDDYTTGELKVDEGNKTVEVALVLTSNIEAAEVESSLEEKFPVADAWSAAEEYGEQEYLDFKLHYMTGVIDASADDADTWSLKAECTVNGKDKICEAKVTGTSDDPEVVEFDVY